MAAQQVIVWQPWARFVDRVDWHRVATVCAAGALGVSVSIHDPIMTWRLGLYAVLLAGTFVAGGYERPPRELLLPTAVVLASVWTAAAVSTNTAATLTLAVWTSLVTPVICIKRPVLVEGLLIAFGAVLFHAGLAMLQMWYMDRVTGLLFNPNAAAGLLALGAIGAIACRQPWLALPMLYALPFTGSRWATLVLVALAGVWFLRAPGQQRLHLIAVILLAAACLAPSYGRIADGYRLHFGADRIASDIERRITTEQQPIGIAPGGVAHIEGLHNVYMRVAHDGGLTAGIAWLALTVLAIWRGRGVFRWAMVALALFGLMDYYTWQIGALSLVWWAALAVCIKTKKQQACP